MSSTISAQFKMKRKTTAEWASMTALAEGEPGFESNTGRLKIGNGSALWSALPYVSNVRTDTESNLGSVVLGNGELAVASDSNLIKIGNNVDTFTKLNPFIESSVMSSPDGVVMYTKSYWDTTALTADFNNVGAVAITGTGNSLAFTGTTASTYPNLTAQSLELKNWISSITSVDFSIVYRVTGSLGASGNATGIAIGRQSKNTGFLEPNVIFHAPTSPGMAFTAFRTAATGPVLTDVISSTPMPGFMASNDMCKLTYVQRGSVVTGIFENFTQKTRQELYLSSPLVRGTNNRNAPTTNLSAFRIYGTGGTTTVLSVELIVRVPYAPTLAIIGDSKTYGENALSPDLAFPKLLEPYFGSVVNAGGSGDRCLEAQLGLASVIALRPKNIILNIGRNDYRGTATPVADWQDSYLDVVTRIKDAGIRVIHLLQMPENSGQGGITAAQQAEINTYINSTYASDTRINPATGWTDSPHLDNDGVHPTPAGMQHIANVILNGTLSIIPRQTNPRIFDKPVYPTEIPRNLLMDYSITNITVTSGSSTNLTSAYFGRYMFVTVTGGSNATLTLLATNAISGLTATAPPTGTFIAIKNVSTVAGGTVTVSGLSASPSATYVIPLPTAGTPQTTVYCVYNGTAWVIL